MRIWIENIIDAETKERYGFNIFGLEVVFVAYDKQIKPKGKRKWHIKECWDSYSGRDSTIKEPNLPDDIKAKTLGEIIQLVTIKTWNEYKNIN